MWLRFSADRTSTPAIAPLDPASSTATLDTPRDINDEISDALRPLVPWFTSLLFHLAIILLALFIIVATIAFEEPIDYPTPRLNSISPPTSLETSGQVELEQESSIREVETEKTADVETPTDMSFVSNDNLMKLVGLEGGAAGGEIGDTGDINGHGSGDSITGTIFETGSGASEVIFVVDASGSLVDTLPFVIAELRRSIAQLGPEQKYSVIFFQDGVPREVPPRGWKTATPRMKQRTFDYISTNAGNIVPRGVTDPVGAIELEHLA